MAESKSPLVRLRQPRFYLPPLIILVCSLLGGLLILTRPTVEPREIEPEERIVRYLVARPGMVQLSVESQGTVAPRSESELIAQVAGIVVWVSPSMISGGFYDKGEELLRIEAQDYEAALERARAAVVRAESEFDRAEREQQRTRKLLQNNAASTAQVDDADNASRVAGAGLREAVANRAQAERDLARTIMRAPFQGRVRSEAVGEGQFVNRGTTLARLYSTDFAEVRLPIPDRQIAFLDLPLANQSDRVGTRGPAVRLEARFAGRPHVWRGELVRTEGEIDPRSRMVHVIARVEDPYGHRARDPEGAPSSPAPSMETPGPEPARRPPLAVGLYVRAEIEGRKVAGVTRLPRVAMRSLDQVLLVDGDDRLRFRSVEVLKADRDEVLISGGLEADERVVVSPMDSVTEGLKVRPLPATPRSSRAVTGIGGEEDNPS